MLLSELVNSKADLILQGPGVMHVGFIQVLVGHTSNELNLKWIKQGVMAQWSRHRADNCLIISLNPATAPLWWCPCDRIHWSRFTLQGVGALWSRHCAGNYLIASSKPTPQEMLLAVASTRLLHLQGHPARSGILTPQSWTWKMIIWGPGPTWHQLLQQRWVQSQSQLPWLVNRMLFWCNMKAVVIRTWRQSSA